MSLARLGQFGISKVAAGGGGGPTAYRYYRLNITANNGDINYIGSNTFALRESVGGADAVQGSGGLGTVKTFLGETYNAAKLFDNSNGTGWISVNPVAFPEWAQWDFGTGNEKVIVEYAVGAYPTSNATNGRSPNAWTFQGSNDLSAWTDLDSQTGQTGWTLAELRVFTL